MIVTGKRERPHRQATSRIGHWKWSGAAAREVTMVTASNGVEQVSRAAAIALIREELTSIAGSDTSMCKAAAEKGIFCGGFRRFDDRALSTGYRWLTKCRPGMTREELEELADRWQLARQEFHQLPLACDVQVKDHDLCRGWDDFDGTELARFVAELTHRKVVVS